MMESMMEYKGYIAAIAYNDAAQALVGSVVNARPGFSAVFEATDVKQLRKEFEISVEDYLAWCKDDGVEPAKPYYGKLQSSTAGQSMDGMNPQPVILVGHHVRLEPVGPQHAADLYAVGQEESIWRYLTTPPFASLDDAREWVDTCVARNQSGERVQFAVVHARKSGPSVPPATWTLTVPTAYWKSGQLGTDLPTSARR